MSSKKPRSKISLRNLLRNKKTAVAAGICCLAAVGVYIGLHLSPSKASDENKEPIRGIVNDLSELKGKTGERQWNDPNNPFVILEIVPWEYYCETGYMIEGCEPIDITKVYSSETLGGAMGYIKAGSVLERCFKDEIDSDLADKEFKEATKNWMEIGDGEVNGYYEKVGKGEGNFQINGLEKDSDDKYYHPTFAEKKGGDWIWVTLDTTDDIFNTHKARENYLGFTENATPPDMENKYQEGDREYMTREGALYGVGTVQNASKPYRHYNDFLRYTLDCHTKKEVDELSVVIKPIVPSELNKHPEWIDYADLVYIHPHDSNKISQYYDEWAKTGDESLNHIKKELRTSKKTGFGKDNDISWEVAQKLFFKANALEQYDGSHSENGMQLNYAPVLMPADLFQHPESQGADSISNSPTKLLNYEDMTTAKNSPTYGTAFNDNIYKFCLMDLLMDPDNFYSLFFSNLESTGKPVIQSVSGEGVCAPQEGKAKTYWNMQTFMPYYDDYWNWTKEKVEKYGFNCDENFVFMNFTENGQSNTAVRGATFIFNSTTTSILMLGNSTEINNGNFTGDAFDWFENEENDPRDKLSTLDVIKYMLNYKKGSDDSEGSRKKKNLNLRILDLEPCSDFTRMTQTFLRAMFPASKYKIDGCKIDHMTTAAFNGSKETLNASYDLIFIGTSIGKFNMSGDGNTTYNDSSLNKKAYLHVGDLVENGSKKYRTSGDDITSLRKEDLISYVNSGNYMLLDDVLYGGKSTQQYKDAVVIDSNLDQLVNKVRSESNVTSVSALAVQNDISFNSNGAEIKITSTPSEYRNVEGNDEKNNTSKLNGNKLTFKFSIGYSDDENESYAVKFLVDTNGDGVISDRENGAETVDTWSMESSAGTTFKPGKKDEEGNEVPAEYTVSYTIPADRTNGPIAWKFVIYNTANENIYQEQSGVSLYRGHMEKGEDGTETATVKEVRVLQVVDTGKESTQADLEEELKKNGLFGTYAKGIKDYKITVKTIPLKNGNSSGDVEKMGWIDSFAYAKAHEEQYPKFAKGGDYCYPSEYLEDYDVYLFSCGDAFQKADNSNGAVAFAAWLADNGKSVVYTSDSIYDTDGSAESVMQMLKDSSGLSRFTSTSSTTKEYNDTPTYGSKKAYKLSDYDNLEYTYYKATQQGASSNAYLPYNKELWQTVSKGSVSYGVGKQASNKASQSNLGTVCIYPYTIDEEIKLQGTQAQDFQLNLENPMADAWYCLGEDNEGDNNTFYSISPNDAANNYYLFNVENVFYSGVDLLTVSGDQEMQLFINTLIGAYEASYSAPYVEVDKAYNRETKKNDTLTLTKFSDLSDKDREDYEARGIERMYEAVLSGVGEKVVETTRYREYVKQQEDDAVLKVTPKPTATEEPPEPEEPEEPEEPDIPEPTPAVPTATPITVYEAGNVEVEYPSCIAKDADWMKELDNDAIMQISYYSTKEVDKDAKVFRLYGGQYEWDRWAHNFSLPACVDKSDANSSTKTQTVTLTIGQIKENLTLSTDDDLGYFELTAIPVWEEGWTGDNPNPVRLLSVRIYTDGGASGSGGKGEEAEKAKEVTVKKSDIFKGTDTHAIYFTPHDGNLVGGKIRSFTANFVDERGNVLLPITKIYRQAEDGSYKMLESPEEKPGQFTIEDSLFLTDHVQYFIPYNKEDANPLNDNPFDRIAFTITNKKRQSTSLLNITGDPEVKKKNNDVYMFNLD